MREGSAYLVGVTASANFPVANPIKTGPASFADGFVTKFSASGTSLDFSTCLGGSGVDQVFSVAVDNVGDVYVTGSTSSIDFPTVARTQSALAGFTDAFVTKLNSSGTALLYSTLSWRK